MAVQKPAHEDPTRIRESVSVDYASGKMEQLSDRGYSYIHTWRTWRVHTKDEEQAVHSVQPLFSLSPGDSDDRRTQQINSAAVMCRHRCQIGTFCGASLGLASTSCCLLGELDLEGSGGREHGSLHMWCTPKIHDNC